MITKFDSSYVGSVDMEEAGYLGKPINDRWYSNEELADVHAQGGGLRQADGPAGLRYLLDGRAPFPAGRHRVHPQPADDGDAPLRRDQEPQDRLRLQRRADVASAPTGRRLRHGRHPDRRPRDLRRGRGYHTREVETFGSPLTDQDANRELFEEGVDVIFKAFNEERFSHKGKYFTLPPEVPYRGYTLKELTLVPRPLRLPVECWQPIQSGSQRAFDFMAKYGISRRDRRRLGRRRRGRPAYDGVPRRLSRRGIELEPGERLALGYQFCIAESREAAMRARPPTFYEENMKMFGELRLVRAITDQQIAAMRDPRLVPNTKLPRIEDAVKAGGFLAGTPADIIEQLKSGREALSGPRARHLHHAARHAALGRHAGAARPLRQGSDAGLPAPARAAAAAD